MRVGLVVDEKVRSINSSMTERGNRITGLILELATEIHQTGLIRRHADPSIRTDWIVGPIATCRDALCVDALAAIKDIEAIDHLLTSDD